MHIYIYNDYGASKVSVEQLFKCIRALVAKNPSRTNYQVESIDGQAIQLGRLQESRGGILCIGGGFDLGYMKSIGETGCEKIREFVSAGGKYLGICAGAYFASSYVQFDMEGPLEVHGERHLKFYSGKACGPVNSHFEYNSDKTAIAARIDFSGQKRHFYLNGGCFFDPVEHQSGLEVLGRYDFEGSQDKPAVVKCDIDRGVCLLSGVHFEFDPNDFQFEEKSKLEETGYELIEGLMQKYFEF